MEEKQSILHELYVFCEWKPEPEYIQKPDSILPENISTIWRWITFFGPKKSLIDSVTAHRDRQQKWHIALGDEGKVIAVLTDNILEIRTKRSDYATIAARTTVSRDAYPQWRKVMWSPDCAFLAVAYGNGIVSFFDLTASNLFNIPADCSRPGGLECTDNTHAVADVIFIPLRVKDTKWNWEVLIVTYDGKLRGYLVSNTDGFKLHHTFNFAGGVAALTYSHHHDSLIVAGLPRGPCKDPLSPLYAGITAWRILNDDPFYKLSVVSDEREAQLVNNRFQMYIPFVSAKNLAFIINMVISPDGNHLVCVHCNGDVTIWRLPLLKLVNRFPLLQQPEYDFQTEVEDEEKTKNKDMMSYSPADVQWWDDQAVILSRFTGAVSVCDLTSLQNLLVAPVSLCGSPRLSSTHDNAFLALECDSHTLPQRRNDSNGSELVSVADTEDEDTVFELTKELFKSIIFAITDMETFQPRPKKITVVSRTYRLLGIKSTTPDELYNRKIESGKYEEALKLADRFSLDSDLVYQQQWRKTPVSSDAIKKYLSKVSKKIWAVHQCVDRLPETLPAAKELLKFGLQLTNDEILNEVNKERDDPHTSPEDISLEDLNAYTSELLRCRHIMLFNKERLKLYEAILKTEKSTYTKEEYDRLCSNSIVHSAIELAKEGRVSALVCLWPHITSIKMQLTVLENLPETKDPVVYENLLPGLDKNGEIVTKTVSKTINKYKDWCRHEKFRSIWNSTWSEDSTPESKLQEESITPEDISKWYDKRARQIEHYSGIITHSITLLEIASKINVKGLEQTLFNLNTLFTIMYELYIDNVCLEQVEKMTHLEICQMLVSKSKPESLLSDLKLYVVPYLQRYEVVNKLTDFTMTGLMTFLESISVNDLAPILSLLQARPEFTMDVRTRIEMAELCLFSYVGTEQFNLACDIVTEVLHESDGSIPPNELLNRQKQLERVIAACGIVWARHVDIPLKELRDMRDQPAPAAFTLRRIANTTVNEKPSRQEWEKLLKDILDLQSILLTCVPKEECYEIYAAALLRSGDASSIRLCSDALTCDSSDTKITHLVPYDKSVKIVINAATEYFNSSSSLNDPALQLARICLKLIKDENQVISDELDLIEAMHILDSFQLPILPIQVRISQDRMQFIEQCLNENPGAIHATHKLLKLAKLLRICPDDELQREGIVLMSVCGRAALVGAGSVRSVTATRLASLRLFPPAPTKDLPLPAHQNTYCNLLTSAAIDPQVPLDRNARRDLLTAAATYCAPDVLHKILKLRLSLELEDVQPTTDDSVLDRCPSTEEEFADAVTTPVVENKDIVLPLEITTEQPLLKYLLDTVQYRTKRGEVRHGKIEHTPKIHVPELYKSLYPEYLISPNQYNYSQFTAPTSSELSLGTQGQKSLGWFYVYHSLDNEVCHLVEQKVLTRCSEELVYTDTPLAVACMMQVEDSATLPSSPAAISARLYALLIRTHGNEYQDNVYFTKPIHLFAITFLEEKATKQQMDDIGECVEQLVSIAEVDRMNKYGYSVNLAMYISDEDYRKEILYRLARSPTQQHRDYAWEVARKREMDTCDLWVQHASTVMTDSEAVKKLTVDGLLDVEKDRGKLADRLKKELWNLVPGNDHNFLINYFNILKVVDDKVTVDGLVPQEHIKLLKKAKAACSELNYKLLLAQPNKEVFLSHMLEIMKPENVGMLTKFLRSLPLHPFKVPVTMNTLYTAWLTKYFFTVSQSAANNKKWMQQYRQCASYFNKLSQNDILEFITNTCFSEEAIERVPEGTRNIMIMQAVDYCQQEQDSDITNINKNEWDQVIKELTRWGKFLENFHSPKVQGIKNNLKTTKREVWIAIEKSHGSVEALVPSLSTLVMEQDLSPAVMTSLLRALKVELDPAAVFTWITQHMVETPIDIQILISRITLYYKEGVKFPDDLIETIMQKATEHGLPLHKQIGLLSLSNKNQIQDGADLQIIAQFILDLLNTEWAGMDFVKDINEELFLSEEGRRKTFRSLLDNADTWQRKKALVVVLNCWSTTETGENVSLQFEYLRYLIETEDQKEALVLIKLLLRKSLVEKEINALIESSPSRAVINLMWIILLNKSDHSIKLIPKLAVQHKDSLRNTELEDDLIKELLDSGLFLKLVSTPLYSPIVNYLISKQMQSEDSNEKYTITWATSELVKANYIAEAGQLHLLTIGIPSPLRSFSDSVKYCNNGVGK